MLLDIILIVCGLFFLIDGLNSVCGLSCIIGLSLIFIAIIPNNPSPEELLRRENRKMTLEIESKNYLQYLQAENARLKAFVNTQNVQNLEK